MVLADGQDSQGKPGERLGGIPPYSFVSQLDRD